MAMLLATWAITAAALAWPCPFRPETVILLAETSSPASEPNARLCCAEVLTGLSLMGLHVGIRQALRVGYNLVDHCECVMQRSHSSDFPF